MTNLWNWDEITNTKTDNPIEPLKYYCDNLKIETDNLFEGRITDNLNEENCKVSYTFFIVAPKLHNYSYKLIELSFSSFNYKFPIEIKLFKLDTTIVTDCANDNKELKDILKKLITSKEAPTKNVLNYLYSLIQIKDSLKDPL